MKDKIETLNERLKEVVDKFVALQESGMDEEILEIFLHHKTKLSRKNVRLVIKHLEEFYDKLIKNSILEEMEG